MARNSKGWELYAHVPGLHVVTPADDLIEHDLFSDDCICGPRRDRVNSEVSRLQHHSLDGREFAEAQAREQGE